MIFVDSNIPMYLVGSAHPHKVDAQRLVEQLVAEQRRLVTDAEVLQEILHRYAAIERRDMIQLAFDVLLGVVSDVFPIQGSTARRAKDILLARRRLSARDLPARISRVTRSNSARKTPFGPLATA